MTFSIAARCPRTGMLGVATSSKALAAGGMVPYCRARVGAIASQSFVNPYLGIDGLELLEHGLTAERTLERLVEGDPGRDLRQLNEDPDQDDESRQRERHFDDGRTLLVARERAKEAASELHWILMPAVAEM